MDLRFYDVIGFGDEVPGVIAVISAAREYRRRTKRYPRVLLMSKANLQEGIGGHLVRGGLAYLDRSQIDRELRQSLKLDTFGSPATIYQEFLQKSNVSAIALDPRKASAALQEMLSQAGVDILSKVEIQSVNKERQRIASITTSKGIVYAGKQFIDATVNGELAQAAGAKKLKGFETFGLPNSELPVTLVFETQGLSVRKLKELDYIYLKRFTNLADSESQKFLLYAAGKDAQLAEELRQEMLDTRGNLKTLWAGNDYIDVRSPALSVAYHSFRGTKLSFPETGVILDEGNIAILPNSRLSWNALLFAVTSSEAEALAKSGSKPTANMQKEILFVATWLRSLGATSVTSASELYIRHAGNVTGVVEPLTGAQMLLGGVPANQALATFSYHFDVRGGIPGMGEKANSLGWFKSLSFKQPTFNIGIRHAVMKNIPNLAVVSPCSGFEGFACSVGRIVEFNAAVGQGVGIAAINAILNNKNIADISNAEVRQVLVETGQLPKIFGVANNADGRLLAQFETLVGADAIA
ncbi:MULTISPECIES: FAD-dependent oxidoreductase [unclassified Tychonema]|uniref:FAD-dependent oxidoreductase n=1 Tax=unclassified Tychonema TaxID=2642144 RepID=UPI001D14E37C|nr:MULTISPECIES: FAD-dependent oxidoreductase [unclassified Tychonema]